MSCDDDSNNSFAQHNTRAGLSALHGAFDGGRQARIRPIARQQEVRKFSLMRGAQTRRADCVRDGRVLLFDDKGVRR